MVPHIEYSRCNFRHSPPRSCRFHYSANSRPTYTAAEVSFPCDRLRAATQPLRRNSSLRCSLTEVLDLSCRRRATAGVSGEQMLDVTGSEDDSGTGGGRSGTLQRHVTINVDPTAIGATEAHSGRVIVDAHRRGGSVRTKTQLST